LTKSADFPTTPDAQQRDLRGKSDAFLLELSPSGEVLHSTLIGGTGDDLGNGLDIDGGTGAVYLGGVTSSRDFKGRQLAKASTDDDAFLCRIELAEHAARDQLGGLSCDPSAPEGAPWNFGRVSDKAGASGDDDDILDYLRRQR
jgi:hypothetical protein